MARTLSTALNTEMNSLDRAPVSKVTVERYLPEWEAKISGLSGGALEQYAHGHSAATATVSGETVLLRARSGSYASPQNGTLYVAVIRDANLDTPANWDSLFSSTGITGLMYPAWSANSGASHGGSISVVDSGTNFRVFYTKSDGTVRYVDVSYTGTVGSETTVASLGTGAQLASMQIAAYLPTELFVMITESVESSVAAGWQPATYATTIRWYTFSGSWSANSSFANQPIIEAGLQRDEPDLGSDFSNTSDAGIRTQWGKRPCGGLAATQLDSQNILVSVYNIQWRRHGYDTHSQGVTHWIFNRYGYWQKWGEASRYDFNEDLQLNIGGFCRGSKIESGHFLVWNRYQEPSDYEQTAALQNLPRITETVVAKFSSDGRYLSQWQYLGDPDELTAASLVAVTRSGVKKLYALGWRSVYESPAAAWLCSVTTPQDLAAYATGWEAETNNRQGGSIGVELSDPSIATDPASVVKPNALVRAYYGIAAEQVQVAQGWIDGNSPALSVDSSGQFDESASLQARPDLQMALTRIEQVEEFLPRSVMLIPPTDDANITPERGYWQLTPMAWPEVFFPGTYTSLYNKIAWRLLSFPIAGVRTNGVQASGDILWTSPGYGWEQYAGTWFKDMAWLKFPAMTEGVFESSVRFGNNNIQSSTNFETKYSETNVKRVRIYATVTKSNGVVTNIAFSKTNGGAGYFAGYDGTPYPKEMNQQAIMAGLVCYAPESGKRYMFVWEYNSNFASATDATANGSSFIRGPYLNERFDSITYSSMGTNMLYLIESDYSGATNWINYPLYSMTATGLTGGQPADMRIQLQGSHIYCYYRAHSTGTKNNWRLAFSHRTGRFGPGRFGIIGRGASPPQWNDLLTFDGELPLSRLFNNVDFWDLKASDGIRDETIEDHLRRFCWRGHTSTTFSPLVNEASRTVTSGAVYNYAQPAENLTADFLIDPTGSGVEGGVFVRGVGASTPQNECIRLGLISNTTANSQGSVVNYYVVKRRYSGGSEVTAARDYAPIPVQYYPSQQIAVRVTVRGPFYAVYVYGTLVAQFTDTTELGLYFGLYSTGASTTFKNIYVPELYEVVGRLPVEANQATDEVIGNIIGKRRIKAFYNYAGALKWSYFSSHPSGPAFNNTMWQSTVRNNPRYISKLRVQGNNAPAVYQSAVLASKGQRYQVINNPEIIYREFAYKEAQAIVAETAERQTEATFEGLPDLRVEPEDQSTFTVTRQEIAGDFIIEDVKIRVQGGENPQSSMTLGTRQTVVL